MQNEINEIIEKNLPAQVGEVLKKRLEQAEQDAAMVKKLQSTISSLEEDIHRLNGEIQEYKKMDRRNSYLDDRELLIEARERNMTVWEYGLKLEEAEKRASDAINFVSMALKSPIYRKTTFENDTWQSYWQNNMEQRHKVGSTKTEETSQE